MSPVMAILIWDLIGPSRTYLVLIRVSWCYSVLIRADLIKTGKQAVAELCQAQVKLGQAKLAVTRKKLECLLII